MVANYNLKLNALLQLNFATFKNQFAVTLMLKRADSLMSSCYKSQYQNILY